MEDFLISTLFLLDSQWQGKGLLNGAVAAFSIVGIISIITGKFKKQRLHLLIFITFLIAALQLPGALTSFFRKNYPDKYFWHLTRMTTEKINKTTPIKINDTTTFVKAEPVDKGIIYNYKIEISAPDIFDKDMFKDDLKKTIPDICKSPDVIGLLNTGRTVTYRYIDQSEAFIDSIKITKDDCNHP